MLFKTRRRLPYAARLAALLSTFLGLAGCGVQHSDENAMPPPGPVASPTPGISGNAAAMNKQGQITIHYHRTDGNYSGAGLWTWDTYQKHTPKQNELMPSGQDDYGLVFQLDRNAYGNSDKIGLLPRMSRDWAHKDGSDRIWTPSLGNEVWIQSGKTIVLASKPNLTPALEAAYADKANVVALQISQPVDASSLVAHVHIRDEHGVDLPISQAATYRTDGPARELVTSPGKATDLEINTSGPLDFAAHSYRASIDGLGDSPVIPRGLLDDTRLFYSADAVLGATYYPSGTVFRVFAPTAQKVSVIYYINGTGMEGRTELPMHLISGGIWETTVPGNLAGKFYMILAEGPGLPGVETLDPYATNTVNSSSRARITPIAQAGPENNYLAHSPAAVEDRVIYEMHVRDFTVAENSGNHAPGQYLGWTEPNTRLTGNPNIKTGLDHLAELGVTDVQIMPVQDFANDETARAYNWGYITTAFFSPEGMYATDPSNDSRVHELKTLISALHQRGIGVIMDVVYNHTSDSAPFGNIVPNYYYRQLPDGSPANGSGCGNEFRSEAPMVRKYILDSLKYWVRDYGVDGFRFDLMALIDRETMTDIAAQLRAIKPNIAIYGEPWTGGDSPLVDKTDKTALLQVPVGAFNDDFRNALKGMPDGPAPGFIQNGSDRDALIKAMQLSDWFATPAQSINYMTCHDNLVLWDKLKLSMPGATDDLLKRTAKLGYLVLFTTPGVPFIQGGEEFGRSKGGDDNSYVSPDSVNEVDWSLKAKNYDLFAYVRDLIAMRKAHPLFRLRSRDEIARRLQILPTDTGLAYEFDGTDISGETWNHAVVIVNPDNTSPMNITLPTGQWETTSVDSIAMGATMSGDITIPAKTGLVLYKQQQ